MHTDYLLKELCIMPLDIELECRALAYRARIKDPQTPSLVLLKSRPTAGKTNKPIDWSRHPYSGINRAAAQLRARAETRFLSTLRTTRYPEKVESQSWEDPKVRAKAIKACAQDGAEQAAVARWQLWQVERQKHKQKHQPAIWDDWGSSNPKLYKDLARAQSTLLLQCRTGVGGFRTHLSFLKVSTSRNRTAQHANTRSK